MEPPSTVLVDVIAPPEYDPLRPQIDEAVSVALAGCSGSVAVLLTTREEVRRLNRDFRGLDEPTDVLTFPSGFGAGGDIAISLPDAALQAQMRGVEVATELVFLAIHGALHLRGLGDETEVERATMVDAMNRVAEQVGLAPDLEWASLLHEQVAA